MKFAPLHFISSLFKGVVEAVQVLVGNAQFEVRCKEESGLELDASLAGAGS